MPRFTGRHSRRFSVRPGICAIEHYHSVVYEKNLRLASGVVLAHNEITDLFLGLQEPHVPVASERASLVRALSTVAISDRRRIARRFLQGLSHEELRYIASYFGACVLEAALQSEPVSRTHIAWEVLQYECSRTGDHACTLSPDLEHKMILLLEYLTCCRRLPALQIAAGSA